MKLCLEMSDKDTSSPVSIECITMYNAGVAGSGVGCVVQLCCVLLLALASLRISCELSQ